jgi:putative phage-type endonuclease
MDYVIDDESSIASSVESSVVSSIIDRGLLIDDMSVDDLIEVENEIFKSIECFLAVDILQISNPIYHEKFYTTITDTMYETISVIYDIDVYEDPYTEIEEFVKERVKVYVETMINPQRSYLMGEEIYDKNKNLEDMKCHIESLKTSYQPTQRTEEWYQYRYNLLTASNIGKVLGSDAKKNSLIFEKCQPLVLNDINSHVNVNSPMHWGNKYEPVSLMVYEHMYETKVEDFGCIKHPNIQCLGASPDGINTDTESNLYGRMVEIKNIVNREITGIPLEAYWIQMQVQMEVCDLDLCDFFETQFKEFDTSDDFYASDKEYTGVILYFVKADGTNTNPEYVYMPLKFMKNNDAIKSWIDECILEFESDGIHRFYSTIYWYLDIMSCVLVPRNKTWFNALRPHIMSTWDIIENERKTGYEHRKPKKRIRKCNVILEEEYKPIVSSCVLVGDTKIINLL